jgi:predicted O-methyltransferase YrrM/tetratricopeptide (TPR) repeat protein
MQIEINKTFYQVSDGEFEKIPHSEYNNLVILKKVGFYERIISLLTTISKSFEISNCIFYGVTHGGYLPLTCSQNFENIYITKTNEKHKKNIIKNLYSDNVDFLDEHLIKVIPENIIIFSEDCEAIIISNVSIDNIFITTFSEELEIQYTAQNIYFLSNSDLCVYVPQRFHESWVNSFHYYINVDDVTGKQILNYDNLINLCIMVKNGGQQFETMLKENMHLIDQWTILDTGSTDDTVAIIKNVLANKKGALYEEPFINFRDSRNRLLELAGHTCKYTLMLDDTYVVNGDLRGFLNEVRGDQWGDSFTLYIKSDDVEYGSNRILRSDRKLRYLYKIHEVIQDKNNVNVVVPIQKSHIFDGRFEYMEERTMTRKQLDLKLLFEELEEEPNNSRTHYYLAQTYNLLKEHEKAYHYFIERANHPNEGFIQEKIDAVFEAARIANFQLKKPWPECEALYLRAYELDKSRPDSIYFLGIHHYMEGDRARAYEYFKLGFEIGYPLHCQYSLKPTLSYHFLPKFLTQLCYEYNNYPLGEQCAKLFLDNNLPNADTYPVIESWYKIFVLMNKISDQNALKNNLVPSFEDNVKPILCFVADGGFNKWSGSTILNKGVGGSETYIIEMARHIQKQGYFQVVVFCNCEEAEDFEGVQYLHLSLYFDFIREKYVHTSIISRFSEYYPATTLGNVDNIYMVAHDLTLSGLVIPIHSKLRKIFCLTEWHVSYFLEQFPILKDYLMPFYYGINPLFASSKSEPKQIEDLSENLKMEICEIELNSEKIVKQKNSFIYSSFPNRGLLQLLQMWSRIWNKFPDASLHIYADIDGEWANNVEPQMMQEIKSLLSTLLKENPNYNIQCYGWVPKSVLADAWKKADYWFYPCTFMETFCLTALEAALTKTTVICNDLAALQNTVGDRGLVIPGNAREPEWQDKALEQLFLLMDLEGQERKNTLITKNYEWAQNLSWENQAHKLLNEHLLTNKIQYVGMYNWVHDLPQGQKAREKFENAIEHFNLNNKNPIPIVLEVGTYAGTSLINIVSRIPNSVGIGIDRWEDYNEDNINILQTIKSNQVERSFNHNIEVSGLEERISGIKGDSAETLLFLIKNNQVFDFIYVDCSHKCLDVHLDLFLSWKLLRKGGILAIDDYMYHWDKVKEQPFEYPFEGVNTFLKKYEQEYSILSKDYRVFIEKK